mmetsp:Transcript_30422/g.80896  ORF Transcript_30422/g.80896 Transcript_30422/m.80896 type:complete len:577 (-) Transcript_30422:1098-2828(-)
MQSLRGELLLGHDEHSDPSHQSHAANADVESDVSPQHIQFSDSFASLSGRLETLNTNSILKTDPRLVAVAADSATYQGALITSLPKFDVMASQVQKILSVVQGSTGEVDKDFNRKRLKERLEAAAAGQWPSGARHQSWLQYIFQMQEEDVRQGIEGNRIIHPGSPFMFVLLVTSALVLLYTAAVIPVQQFMWDYDDPCHKFPTLEFDVAVDCFFIIEVLLQFFVGYYDEGTGAYVDSLPKVAVYYLSSPFRFWFDAVTSIPFSWIDLKYYRDCEAGYVEHASADTKTIRLLKIFRFIRLARFARMLKFVIIIHDYVVIYVGAMAFKIARLLVVASMLVHLYACIFWRLKLDYSSEQDRADFLDAKGVDPEDLAGTYLVCFYFVWTVMVTVGFGDIYANNMHEAIFCIFLFLTGGTIFAMLVAQINEIVSSLQESSKALDEYLDSYLAIEPRLPVKTLMAIRAFERFTFREQQNMDQHKAVLSRESLPEGLKVIVAQRVENNLFSKVLFLSELDMIKNIRCLFSGELLLKSETKYYSEKAVIVDHKEFANGLMVVQSGQARDCCSKFCLSALLLSRM